MSAIDEPLRFDLATLGRAAPAPVLLVGAGPGDPDLLTLKAARAIAEADVVLHDALVGEGVLALLPPGAQRVDVGKQSGCHTLSQEGIIELMVRLATSGRRVLRLKGGDPFIFGRGGEEAEALAAAGIPFEVVPGITAAQGAAAHARLPLTHRDHADCVVYVTGHARGPVGEAPRLDLDWPRLVRPRQTLVVYMGLQTLPLLSAGLIAHGLAADTPAAIVERATRTDERVTVGTVETLPVLARVQRVRSPALVLVGPVVRLRAVLNGVAAVDSPGRCP